MKRTFIPVLLLILGCACLSAQSTYGDSLKAQFSSDGDAQAFAAWAESMGQGNGAMITRNEDGSTSVILPDVATEKMADRSGRDRCACERDPGRACDSPLMIQRPRPIIPLTRMMTGYTTSR
jgi:hypothetical protein